MTSTTTTTTSTTSTTSVRNQQQPWVEKYRPKNLQSVSHQNEVVATLQSAVTSGNLPHLLFYGPPGSGKTSVALALCRQLWHPSQYHRRVLELNASDERGISMVRDKIKHFASLSVGSVSNQSNSKSKSSFFATGKSDTTTNDENHPHAPNSASTNTNDDQTKQYPNPPFKIIILDEADTVTPDAQAALRRIIEANSRVTRFILICNYVTRIIEPLASRCAKFRFQSLPMYSMQHRLQEICTLEHCPDLVVSHLDDIIRYADGDMRRAVTTLQSVHSIVTGSAAAASLQSSSSSNKKSKSTISSSSSLSTTTSKKSIMSSSMIAEIVGVPPLDVITELWNACTQSKYDIMHVGVENVIASGFSAQLIVSALLTQLLVVVEPPSGANETKDEMKMDTSVVTNTTTSLDELSLAQIAIRIAEAEKNMMDGADEYLQLMTVCSLIFTCCNHSQTH